MAAFEWDASKSRLNQTVHGVAFDEAVSAFADPLGRIVEDRRHRGRSRGSPSSRSRRVRAFWSLCSQNERSGSERSALVAPLQPNAANMKKPHGKRNAGRTSSVKRPTTIALDELLPEYDFAGGRPNKYAAAFDRGCTMIVLEPDVAAAFPSAVEVNELLRAVASAMRKPRTAKRVRRAPTKRSA